MTLHLFNPENDLALGLGCRNYTPPPHAAALHLAGQLLPLWWAEKGDAVVAPAMSDDEFRWMELRFGLSGGRYEAGNDVVATPWGWSLDARRQFLSAGVPAGVLPSEERVEEIRRISHRRSAIKLLRGIGYHGVMPMCTDSVVDAQAFIDLHGSCYVKSPWSGSGRGVFNTSGLGREPLRARLEGIIHRQGSVIVEKSLRRVADFAVLYQIASGRAEVAGLSWFETEPRGMYVGNLVAPQQMVADRIAAFVGQEKLSDTVESVRMALESVIGIVYEGPVGVDMMVHDAGSRYEIMPCIEINLRRTMGFAAMSVAERLEVTTPRFLSWRRGPVKDDEVTGLLPPVNDFSLILE